MKKCNSNNNLVIFVIFLVVIFIWIQRQVTKENFDWAEEGNEDLYQFGNNTEKAFIELGNDWKEMGYFYEGEFKEMGNDIKQFGENTDKAFKDFGENTDKAFKDFGDDFVGFWNKLFDPF